MKISLIANRLIHKWGRSKTAQRTTAQARQPQTQSLQPLRELPVGNNTLLHLITRHKGPDLAIRVKKWLGTPRGFRNAFSEMHTIGGKPAQLCKGIDDIVCRFDPITANHQQGVAAFAVAFARHLKVSPRQIKVIEIAARSHDLGKVPVGREIVNKPGRLDPNEVIKMKMHPAYSCQILEAFGVPRMSRTMRRALHLVEHHHSSYKEHGARNAQIIQILKWADQMDALMFKRGYPRHSDANPSSLLSETAETSCIDEGTCMVYLKGNQERHRFWEDRMFKQIEKFVQTPEFDSCVRLEKQRRNIA